MQSTCTRWQTTGRHIAFVVIWATSGATVFAESPTASNDAPKPLPESVTATWVANGAGIGWMRTSAYDGWPTFRTERKPGDVPAFSFGREAWNHGLVTKLPRPQQAFGLDLTHPRVTDSDLEGIGQFENLAALCLLCPKITDDGLKALKGLRALRSLDLAFTQVTGSGLNELKGLERLESLNLSYTRIADAGMKDLKQLKSLRSLDLAFAHVTDDGAKELTGLEHLQSLNLSHTIVTDAGIKHLKDLKSLTLLDLASTQVSDAGLKDLKQIKSLQSLDLSRTEVTESGLAELKDVKGLTTLHTSAKVSPTSEKRISSLGIPRWTDQRLLIGLLAVAVIVVLLATGRRVVWLWALGAFCVGLLFWGSADWTVYYESYMNGRFLMEPRFRLNGIEQVALSAIGGASTALAFSTIYLLAAAGARQLGTKPRTGHTDLDKAALGSALAGLVTGATSLYLGARVGGDLFAHFYFLGTMGLSYWLLASPCLFVCEVAALLLGLSAEPSPSRKAAMTVALCTGPIGLLGLLMVALLILH
jgi:internalin A